MEATAAAEAYPGREDSPNRALTRKPLQVGKNGTTHSSDSTAAVGQWGIPRLITAGYRLHHDIVRDGGRW
jgi:hypothetical protein